VDYNGGFVMPAAIDRELLLGVGLTTTGSMRMISLVDGVKHEVPLASIAPTSEWTAYALGVVALLGETFIQGVDLVVGGNIPVGSGLSSSAALAAGFAFALNELSQLGRDKVTLARIARDVEHRFAGVRCGLMDPYAVLHSEPGHVLLMDCLNETHKLIPAPLHSFDIVLADTGVKHSLASSEYNQRRAACERALAVLRRNRATIASWRDVTADDLAANAPELGSDLAAAQYVAEEIGRTTRAAGALAAGNLAAFGRLMFETHRGLRDLYRVSCPELDVLVEGAAARPDVVFGARMMGGGFGGCTINLVRRGAGSEAGGFLADQFSARFGLKPHVFPVSITGGVSEVTDSRGMK
jgi:galactokinase